MTHPYTKALFEASGHQPDRGQTAHATPLLKVDNVIRDYTLPRRTLFGPAKTLRAVDHVSFEIKRGESLGLVGESGCGKSTLTRAILGLEKIQGGEILLDGDPVWTDGAPNIKVRRKMQVVFQDPYGSFNPRHKVARLVGEPFHLLNRSASVSNIDTALRSVGLSPEDKHKYIHEFSGGQRQRIAIARALIIKPELIILDEAVSALDVSIRAQILDLLADLSDRFGLTYLFISHDLSVVRSITDRVLVMQRGKIVEQGETQRVFDAPQHDYTKSLIAAVPKLPAL
jgi:peptide/nickel transport system ATP-binding protein